MQKCMNGMSMRTVNVFNIQHFSVHDGPGVRTVVFFKGCNLHCRWCHNPESIHDAKDILLYPDRCIGCGACVQQCPIKVHSFDGSRHIMDREKCIHCFKCCEECYADALVCVGEERQMDAVLKEIQCNRGYFEQSGGGVTFSGGECMLQIDALTELLKCCKEEGIHTAVDTAGNVPWSYFEKVLPWTDLFLYDIKAHNPEVHKKCTGVTNERILHNFRILADQGARIIVRIPYIPELNGTELEAIATFLSSYPQLRVELLPYHSMGNPKYHALGVEEVFIGTVPDRLTVQKIKEKYHFY